MISPKNSGKAPAFQFYPADWRKDTGVQMLEFHDKGVWFEMICIMHECEERGVLTVNGQPMRPPAIARILGLDNQTFNQTLSNLLTYGVAKQRDDDGAIFCKRMVEDEKLSKIRRDAGKLGGNPNLVNQNASKTQAKDNQTAKQKPTPSSSSSSSSSVSSSPSLSTAISKRERFTPPSIEEWVSYGQTLNPVFPKSECLQTHSYYESKGWKVGSSPMKNWQAAMRTCHGRWSADLPSSIFQSKDNPIEPDGWALMFEKLFPNIETPEKWDELTPTQKYQIQKHKP